MNKSKFCSLSSWNRWKCTLACLKQTYDLSRIIHQTFEQTYRFPYTVNGFKRLNSSGFSLVMSYNQCHMNLAYFVLTEWINDSIPLFLSGLEGKHRDVGRTCVCYNTMTVLISSLPIPVDQYSDVVWNNWFILTEGRYSLLTFVDLPWRVGCG